MIQLKLNVSDVDYDAVIRALGGKGKAGEAFSVMTAMLPDDAKEEFAAGLINSNAEALESMLEASAKKLGIRLRLSGAQASVVNGD